MFSADHASKIMTRHLEENDSNRDIGWWFREHPTRVLPRERRRLFGFAHGPAFVALGQRVAFLLPHNKPSASMLRVNNASPFYLLYYSVENAKRFRQNNGVFECGALKYVASLTKIW
jgi:hypothetical protein